MAKLVPKIYPNDSTSNPIGIGFPLVVGSPNHNYTTTAQVHDNLRNLILTMKGERIMQPTFGSDIYLLLFENIYDQQLTDSATIAIKSAVATWMPFVTINNVDVTSDVDNNKTTIQILYSVQGWPAENILNLSVDI